MKTSKNKKKKEKRANQGSINTFPTVGEALHQFAKAFDIEGDLKRFSNVYSSKKIERFWNGEAHFEEVTNICFGSSAITNSFTEKCERILERYELIARKVTIYKTSKESVTWSLLSRFWVPFGLELFDATKISPKARQNFLSLLQEGNPIQVVFNRFISWTGCSNWQGILTKLGDLDQYNPRGNETDWLRKRLQRLGEGELFKYDIKNELVNEVLKAIGRSKCHEFLSAYWYSWFRIAYAVKFLRDKINNLFGEDGKTRLFDFISQYETFYKNRKNQIQKEKSISFVPYLMGLEINAEGNSTLHNMIDSDLHRYGMAKEIWDLPDSNHDWLTWNDPKPLSKQFLKFFEEVYPDSDIFHLIRTCSKPELISEYLSKIKNDPNDFKTELGLAIIADRVFGTDKALECLYRALPLADSETKRLNTLLFQLYCHCDLEREKAADEHEKAEDILEQIMLIKEKNPDLSEPLKGLFLFLKARVFLLNGELKDAAKQYNDLVKNQKIATGEILKLSLIEGTLAAAKVDKNTKTLFKNLYREGYRKVLYTIPWDECENYMFDHVRKEFYTKIPSNTFFKTVDIEWTAKEANRLAGKVKFTENDIKRWLHPKDPNKPIKDFWRTRLTYPLIIAVSLGLVDDTKRLLESGANVNLCNSNNESALLHSLYTADQGLTRHDEELKGIGIELTNLILNSGVSVETINASSNRKNETALFIVIKTARVEIIRRMIELGVDINKRVLAANITPLYYALQCIKNGKQAVAQGRIKKEFFTNPENIRYATDTFSQAIFYDEQSNAKKAYDALIEADFSESSQEAEDKRFSGDLNRYREIAKLLIKAGADLDEKNKNGHTALTFASELKEVEIVKLLIEHGADISMTITGGGNALTCAIIPMVSHEITWRENPPVPYGTNIISPEEPNELIEILLNAGVDTSVKLRTDLTAIDLARLSDQPEIVSIIEKRENQPKQPAEQLYMLGLQYTAQGTDWIYKSIATHLEAAERNNIRSIRQLASLLSKIQGCEDKTKRYLNILLELSSADDDKAYAYSELGTLALRMSQFNEVKPYASRAIDHGAIGSGYYLFGMAEIKSTGDMEKAKFYFEKSIENEFWEALVVLGHIYFKWEGNPDKAERTWSEALEKGVLAASMELGKFYEFYKRDLQLAERYYSQAKSVQPAQAERRLKSLKMKIG